MNWSQKDLSEARLFEDNRSPSSFCQRKKRRVERADQVRDVGLVGESGEHVSYTQLAGRLSRISRCHVRRKKNMPEMSKRLGDEGWPTKKTSRDRWGERQRAASLQIPTSAKFTNFLLLWKEKFTNFNSQNWRKQPKWSLLIKLSVDSKTYKGNTDRRTLTARKPTIR